MVPIIRKLQIGFAVSPKICKIFGLATVATVLFFILYVRQSEGPPVTFEPKPNQPLPPDLLRKEAPMLEKLVSEGKLPPLEERLPRNPAVVEPVNEPGRYGGVWRRHTIGADRAG